MTDYYDGLIGNITVTGHLVRADFLSQASPASRHSVTATRRAILGRKL